MHSCSSEVLNLKVPSRCSSITIRDRTCSSSQKLERLEQLMFGDSRGQRLDDGSVLETRLPFFRIHKAEIGIVKKSHRKGWEDWMAVLPESHRKDHHDYRGEVPHQCCGHPDHYHLRLSLGISSVRWESQSLVSLSTPSRKLTRSRLSVPPAIILPVYFKAL